MAAGESDLLERNIGEPDACDMSRASYSKQLSSMGMASGNDQFHATIDKVAFRQVVDVVTTVLQAHGYSLNLENILASLDTFRLSARVKLTPTSVHRTPAVARSFTPAIQFNMPAKHRVGALLQKFYDEIRAYEAEIARLQEKTAGREPDDKAKSRAQMGKELKALRAENQALAAKLADLARTLSELQRSHADVSRALAAQNLLPANIRIATVREVDVADRHVTLRAGRASFGAPLAHFQAMPKTGLQCLVTVNAGRVDSVFLHEEAGSPLELRPAHVLYVSCNRCKLRDDRRRTWLFEAKNGVEEATIRQLARGDHALVHLFEDALVRVQACHRSNSDALVRQVQQAIAMQQLSRGPSTVASDQSQTGHPAKELR